MKITYKGIRSFSFVFGAVFLIYIVFSITKSLISWSEVMSTRKSTFRSIPEEYMSLFNANVSNKFTELSTVRYPVSYFDYDNNKYRVIITKMNAVKNVSIDGLIKVKLNAENVEERAG